MPTEPRTLSLSLTLSPPQEQQPICTFGHPLSALSPGDTDAVPDIWHFGTIEEEEEGSSKRSWGKGREGKRVLHCAKRRDLIPFLMQFPWLGWMPQGFCSAVWICFVRVPFFDLQGSQICHYVTNYFKLNFVAPCNGPKTRLTIHSGNPASLFPTLHKPISASRLKAVRKRALSLPPPLPPSEQPVATSPFFSLGV